MKLRFNKYFKRFKKTKIIILSLLLIFIIYLIWLKIPTASNNRDWSIDQSTLAYATINGDKVTIYNIRNFSYTTTSDYTPSYYDKTFDLTKLDSVWYLVEPFSDFGGTAHTLMSFGFGDDYVALSVEIRKERGEEFSAWKGLFKKYELMYILGDEEDLVKLRTNYRKDEVFLYPINTTKERIKAAFLDVIKRVNKLKENPEYYHTISNTCTTNLAEHANTAVPGRISFLKIGVFLPGYSDKLAYNLGIINTSLPYEEIRSYYKINERAMQNNSTIPFSKRIRLFE